MYYRRKILLELVASFGNKGVDKIKLQKLLFLFCQEQKETSFHFVPYRFGCFSFQATQDLSVLARHYGLLKESEKRFIHIDRENRRWMLKQKDQLAFEKIRTSFANRSRDEMVDYVYEKYPYYAIRSEWESMTHQQRATAQKERRKIAAKDDAQLFTIGYEERDIDNYLNLLVENNIRILCDVRKNALSMKYGFSKKQLSTYCEKLDIKYIHIPDLGIASKRRKSLKNSEDYQRLFKRYRRELPKRQAALSHLDDLFQEYGRVALTCFEKEYRHCHRQVISEYFEKGKGVTCQHL